MQSSILFIGPITPLRVLEWVKNWDYIQSLFRCNAALRNRVRRYFVYEWTYHGHTHDLTISRLCGTYDYSFTHKFYCKITELRFSTNMWKPRFCDDTRSVLSSPYPWLYCLPPWQNNFPNYSLGSCSHQIPVAEEDITKTAIKTPVGLFELLKMSFRIRNTGQTFQRLIGSRGGPV